MSEAMTAFHNKLFKKYHKSSYSEEDIAVLDEYRTTANVGMVLQPKENKTIELDISKAYASAFSNITKIPPSLTSSTFGSHTTTAIYKT